MQNHFFRINHRKILAAAGTLFFIALLGGCGSDSASESVVPSLTAPPGADDEPVTESSEFNTAIGFQVTREPGARLPEVQSAPEITDDEFDQGLPQPVVEIPEGIDSAVNQPPFFTGLQNLTVEAGDLVSIVFDPEDPEGEVPGMFPVELPQGGTFDDNFDGTKTFNWQPLQMDVGILEFTVVALDPANQLYRTSQSVLIKVNQPDDPSTIPNVAPMLEPIPLYTARINDPVVIELKGVDLNGSIPTIEIPQLATGMSINPHPRFEEIYVLKFTPSQLGNYSIDVLLRDSVDTSLTAIETVSISVLSDNALELSGERLKALAQNRDVLVGFAARQSFYHQPDGALYANIAAQEFNVVTPENSMKMDAINPLPGRYQFAATDNLVAYAKSTGMQVRGHPLLWHRQLPSWILETPIEERETHMSEYIGRILNRYGTEVVFWDVINEPINEDGSLRESIWLEAMGESYIDKALAQVRSLAPNAKLLINEFDISMAGAKFDGLMQLVDRLQLRAAPLDSIGFQMHLFTSFDRFDELRANFAAVASRGLDIHITELDVSLAQGASQADQADVYEQVVSICLEFAQCKVIQMWGFTDQYSFRAIFNPLPFDAAYQPKPAYQALQRALGPVLP